MRLPTTALPNPLILSALLLLGLGAARPATAEWSEGNKTILRIDEAAALTGTGLSARGGVAMDWPVLLPEDWRSLGDKAMQVAVIQSGLAARQGAAGLEIFEGHALSERERAERRRIPHFAITPRQVGENVVDSGGVALFGKLLAPPFQVEAVGDEVQINGVAVYPSPGPNVAAPRVSGATRATHDNLVEAAREFSVSRDRGDGGAAKQRLLATMLAQPDVVSARWVSETDLELTEPDGSVRMLSMGTEGRDAEPADESALREHLDGIAAGLRAALAQGFTVLAGADYLDSMSDVGAAVFRTRLAEIKASGDSEALKLARIQAYTGLRNAAADLLWLQ